MGDARRRVNGLAPAGLSHRGPNTLAFRDDRLVVGQAVLLVWWRARMAHSQEPLVDHNIPDRTNTNRSAISPVEAYAPANDYSALYQLAERQRCLINTATFRIEFPALPAVQAGQFRCVQPGQSPVDAFDFQIVAIDHYGFAGGEQRAGLPKPNRRPAEDRPTHEE